MAQGAGWIRCQDIAGARCGLDPASACAGKWPGEGLLASEGMKAASRAGRRREVVWWLGKGDGAMVGEGESQEGGGGWVTTRRWTDGEWGWEAAEGEEGGREGVGARREGRGMVSVGFGSCARWGGVVVFFFLCVCVG